MRPLRALLVFAAALAGALACASPAAAASTTQVIEGEYIRLVSVADWQKAGELNPGEKVRWDVAISADAPEPGAMQISLSADGGTHLAIDAALCAVAWRGDACPAGPTQLRSGWGVPHGNGAVQLSRVSSAETVHLRLRVGLAEPGGGEPTVARVHVTGPGEGVSVASDQALAQTGASSAAPRALLLGAVMLVSGAALVIARGRRRGSRGDS